TAEAPIPDPIAVHADSAVLNVHFHPPLTGEFRIAAPHRSSSLARKRHSETMLLVCPVRLIGSRALTPQHPGQGPERRDKEKESSIQGPGECPAVQRIRSQQAH